MLVFISDTHLGNRFAKEPLLRQFLDGIRKVNHRLILVGDIFDLWRDPDVSKYQGIFNGIDFRYIVGNHDKQLELLNSVNPLLMRNYSVSTEDADIIALHGDEFDTGVAYPGPLTKAFDAIVYAISCALGFNLKALVKPLSDAYYWATGFNHKVWLKYGVMHDVALVGHTHVAGEFEFGVKDRTCFRVFNLGSWLHHPHAFFFDEEANKYAFVCIDENHLLPKEEDYRSLR